MDMADSNNDGKLCFSEFKKIIKLAENPNGSSEIDEQGIGWYNIKGSVRNILLFNGWHMMSMKYDSFRYQRAVVSEKTFLFKGAIPFRHF